MKKILITALGCMVLLNAEINIEQDIKNKDNINIKIDNLVKDVVIRNGDSIKQYLKTLIAKKQVTYEKGIYDPLLTSNFLRQSTNVANSVENELIRSQETYQDRVDFFDVGVSGLLPTGGQWSFLFTNNKKQSSLIDQNKNYDTEYDSSVKLELEQPLLKNAGKSFTEAKINLSKLENEINKNQFKQKIMELQGLVIQVYWRLYGAQKIYESWDKSIKITKKSLEDLKFRVEKGKIAQTEYLEAKSAMSIRMSEYENAKNRFNEARNQLLTLLNIRYDENNNYDLVLLDKPNNNHGSNLTLKEYTNLALDYWPEYINAKKNLKKERLQKNYSENQTLPELNLVGSIERTTLQTNRHDSFDSSIDPDFSSWTLGMKFSMPIFNEQAKSSLEISRLKLKQAEVSLKTLENNLVNSIATKMDSVLSSKKQYMIYKEGMDIKEHLLEIEHKKLLSGKANSKTVLNKEEEYMDFKRKYLSSLVNWKTSEALLEIATGNLLNKYDISFSEIEKSLGNY